MINYLLAGVLALMSTLVLFWLLTPECWSASDCIDYPCVYGSCQCPVELRGFWRCNIDDHFVHPDPVLVLIVMLAAVAVLVFIYAAA